MNLLTENTLKCLLPLKKEVINIQTASFYVWGDSCKSFVLLDSEGLSIKQELMPPGTKEKLHFQNKAQQFFYILKGEAVFFREGKFVTLKEREGVHISPSEKHFVENRTNEEVEFLVISEPDTKDDRIISENELDKK